MVSERGPFSFAADLLDWLRNGAEWSGKWVRLLLRGLWVARISTLSVIAAYLLFQYVPQAQDLFIDLKWQPAEYPLVNWAVVHWTLFFVLVLLLWAVPVHFSARLALQTSAARIGVETRAQYRAIVVYLPRALSALCLICITVGIHQAYQNLPTASAGHEEQILNHAKQQLKVVSWVSVALNVALVAVFLRLSTLPILKRLNRVLPPVYRTLCALLDWLSQPPGRLFVRPKLPPHRPSFLDDAEFNIQRNILVSVTFLLTVIWLIDSGLVALSAKDAQTYLPRALLVPILLGAFVPGFTFLAVLSHRTRHPIIIYFLVVMTAINSLQPTWHDLRCVTDTADDKRCAQVPGPRQVSIEQAVKAWMQANACSGANCPPPIIVAAEGGAGRAAFFTASVLAHLEELSRVDPRPEAAFSNRLFAISTVSGSSLGAAVFVGVREAEQQNRLNKNPWPNRLWRPWNCSWFGCHVDVEEKVAREFHPLGIKSAVQQVLAGDFLTPVLTALAFHDLFGRFFGMSRAAVLEQAWDDRFEEIAGDSSKGGIGPTFMSRPLSRLAPDLSPTLGGWSPILVFNGTSVDTGRRIVTSSIARKYGTKKHGTDDQVFQASFDFYQLMCSRKGTQPDCECQPLIRDLRVPTCDIRLSTAVSNAARFPVVTPPGNIRSPPGSDRQGQKLVQLIVDGGYFDNFGVVTAAELAEAMHQVNPELKPFILQITNDPEGFPEDCGSRAPEVRRGFHKFFGIVRDPLDTVLNSRTGRGHQATEAASRRVNTWNGSYEHIRVCAERSTPPADSEQEQAENEKLAYKQLSMSWWLSMPVQQYIHKQLLEEHNRKRMERVLAALR